MDTKNNRAWNDCERCEDFVSCYWVPKTKDGTNTMLRNVIFSLAYRDLCVNNGKRLFVDKDKKN